MNTILYKHKKDDPHLHIQFAATVDGNVFLDTFDVTPLSIHIYGNCKTFSAVAAKLENTNLFIDAQEFFKKHADTKNQNGDPIRIDAQIFYGNGGNSYWFEGVPFLQHQLLGGMEVMMHFSVVTEIFQLLRTDEDDGGNTPLSPEALQEIETAAKQGMAWQAQHPPAPLSVLERMRRNAARRFSGGESAPTNATGTAVADNGQQKIFDPSCLKITKGAAEPEKELERIVGLDSVKREFQKMKASLLMQKERASQLGLTTTVHSGHMCFMGAPGTGKTTMARLVAGVLFEMGMIRKNQCVEISGLDLLANYLGQTAIKTQATVDYAKGGVLFIDEAYAITTSSYGSEAVGVLLKEMEDNRDGLVVILAGYEKDMDRLLAMNEGFRSRINRYFKFENYTVPELAQLYMFNLRSRNLMITEDALRESLCAFARATNDPNFSNGRFVRNFTERVEDRHVLNVYNGACDNPLNLIRIEDVKE